MTAYPPTSGALTRHVQMEGDVQRTSGATGVEIRLLDTTHGGNVVTGTDLTSAATGLARVSSGDLTVGSATGNIRNDIPVIYEFQVQMNGGGPADEVFCSGGRLIISYT